jgi:hypothetical protein
LIFDQNLERFLEFIRVLNCKFPFRIFWEILARKWYIRWNVHLSDH